MRLHHDIITAVPGPEGVAPDGGYSSMMFMMMGWVVMATALFLLRPKSLRAQGNEKPAPGRGVCRHNSQKHLLH